MKNCRVSSRTLGETYQSSGPRPASRQDLQGGLALSWIHLLLIRRHLGGRVSASQRPWPMVGGADHLRQAMGALRLILAPSPAPSPPSPTEAAPGLMANVGLAGSMMTELGVE